MEKNMYMNAELDRTTKQSCYYKSIKANNKLDWTSKIIAVISPDDKFYGYLGA